MFAFGGGSAGEEMVKDMVITFAGRDVRHTGLFETVSLVEFDSDGGKGLVFCCGVLDGDVDAHSGGNGGGDRFCGDEGVQEILGLFDLFGEGAV